MRERVTMMAMVQTELMIVESSRVGSASVGQH